MRSWPIVWGAEFASVRFAVSSGRADNAKSTTLPVVASAVGWTFPKLRLQLAEQIRMRGAELVDLAFRGEVLPPDLRLPLPRG